MMQGPLFTKSWHEVHNYFVRQAIAEVEKLDEKVLFDPQLAGALEKIAARYALDVARMHTQAGTAKPVKFNTGHGIVDALEVPISFTGSPNSFQVSPSSSHLIHVPKAEVEKSRVVVTVYDDGNSGREIEDFIKRGNENLDRLRDEVKRYDGQLLKTITDVAERRKASIEERRKRDEKLPFKVDRG